MARLFNYQNCVEGSILFSVSDPISREPLGFGSGFGIRILIQAGQNDNQIRRKNHSLQDLGSDGRLSWSLDILSGGFLIQNCFYENF
jgi:hypothetical protein